MKSSTKDSIFKFLGWIDTPPVPRRKIKTKHSPRTFSDGDTFFYQGTPLTLTIGNYPAIKATETHILFPKFLEFRLEKELEKWFIQQAKNFITSQVEFYAKKMDTHYSSISFADTKSKWGHCTHDNQLQFNWRLIMAPPLTATYVVVHELAHTKEKHHQRSFWDIVKYYSPTYKIQRNWLKANGHKLLLEP